MRSIHILISFLLLLSCSKRTVDLQAVKTKTRIDSKLDSSTLVQLNKKETIYQFSFEDSENQYWVDITPDTGKVEFNPLSGFMGKARKISIRGHQKKKANTVLKSEKIADSTGKTNLKKTTSNKSEGSLKNKSSITQKYNFMGVLTVVSVFALIIGAIYLFLRYKSHS